MSKNEKREILVLVYVHMMIVCKGYLGGGVSLFHLRNSCQIIKKICWGEKRRVGAHGGGLPFIRSKII